MAASQQAALAAQQAQSAFSQQQNGQAYDASQQRQQAAYYGQDVDDDDAYLEDGDEVDLIPADYGQADDAYLDEAGQAALLEAQHEQQAQAQAAALAAVPDQVRKYIVLFHQAIVNNSIPEISSAYESNWNRLTEKYFQKTEWPEAEVIAPLVGDDQRFLTLYRELWYRHVYSRLSPDGEDRFHSYDNYCDFFNYVLNSEGPVPLDLPAQWLWDIVDEFIYQFQSYSQWRNRVNNKTEDELLLLQDGGVWSSYSVLNVLYSLIQKSRITEQLQAVQAGEDPEEAAGEFGNKPLYKMLGYFSIIGLLRVHVLLGDYTLALKMLDHLELNRKGGSIMNKVTACHVTAYYYVGFAYLMQHRYPDAIRAFTHILVFIMRLRQYHTRSYQYDQINKTADRMYALLAIACALCPTRLDENIQTALRDKYGDQLNKMSRGEEGLAAFEELFLYACPKFITSNAPPYHDGDALADYQKSPMPDPAQHQVKVFLADVKTQLSNGNIRSFLRLYTSLGTDKLANFLEVDEEELIEELMVAKASSRSLKWSEGGLLEGEVVNTSDLDFVIDGNMVHIAESRVGRRFGEWFMRQGIRMNQTLHHIKSKPLPIPDDANAAAQVAAATATGSKTGDRRPGAYGGAFGGGRGGHAAKRGGARAGGASTGGPAWGGAGIRTAAATTTG